MLNNLIRVLISVFFLGLLVYMLKDDAPAILETLRNVRPAYVAMGLAVFTCGVLVIAKRLQLIFGLQNTPLTYAQSLHITYIGYFFNNFLPTAVGGDLVKAWCAARLTGERLKSFTCVLMDRIFGLMMFVMIPSATILFLMHELDPAVPLTIGAVFTVACLVAILIFNRSLARRFRFIVNFLHLFNLGEKIVNLYDCMHSFKAHKKAVAAAFGLSLVSQILMITAIHFFVLSLSADMSVWYIFLLTPVVNLMSMVPSINGLGVRETAFVVFFRDLIGASNASALAILYLFLLCVQSVIGAVVYLARQDLHFRFKELPADGTVAS